MSTASELNGYDDWTFPYEQPVAKSPKRRKRSKFQDTFPPFAAEQSHSKVEEAMQLCSDNQCFTGMVVALPLSLLAWGGNNRFLVSACPFRSVLRSLFLWGRVLKTLLCCFKVRIIPSGCQDPQTVAGPLFAGVSWRSFRRAILHVGRSAAACRVKQKPACDVKLLSSTLKSFEFQRVDGHCGR